MTTLADLTGVDGDTKITIFKVQTDGHNHFGSEYYPDYCATVEDDFYTQQHEWIVQYLKGNLSVAPNWIAVSSYKNGKGLIVGASERFGKSVCRYVNFSDIVESSISAKSIILLSNSDVSFNDSDQRLSNYKTWVAFSAREANKSDKQWYTQYVLTLENFSHYGYIHENGDITPFKDDSRAKIFALEVESPFEFYKPDSIPTKWTKKRCEIGTWERMVLIDPENCKKGSQDKHFNNRSGWLHQGMVDYMRFLEGAEKTYHDTNNKKNDRLLPSNDFHGNESTNSLDANAVFLASNYPRNQIYFGAPGTGKSYALNEEAKKRFRGNVERVTFYADYLHSQFVGSYKPVMDDANKDIQYKFQPGPFSRVLVKALEHEDTPYCLIIEELNRAEAASVFGDLFQLLDRDSNGVSQYPVSVSEDFKKYLKDKFNEDEKEKKKTGAKGQERLNELVKKALYSKSDNLDAEAQDIDCDMIVIPSNMYIWATMNSADQGVFPLDTAFKRRWNFRYFPLDEGVKELHTENDMRWNQIREAINKKLIELGVNEDKCMGPFFLNEEERNNDFDKAFENKVIMYLFEDAAKYHKELFAQQNMTLSDLFAAWDNNKKSVFCDDVSNVPEPAQDGNDN